MDYLGKLLETLPPVRKACLDTHQKRWLAERMGGVLQGRELRVPGRMPRDGPRCRFSLEELTYQYPEEAIVPGKDAQASLEHYVWECAPAGVVTLTGAAVACLTGCA
ncbi:hypothetical protein ELI30_34205 (plasmid) [Rhizobium leguminosarum]|nr:hypothetical protein ELI40_30980 [Rhizobium leguminosarum]TAU74054.1 hypothetical protein ELI41_34035 [Rhizobium leguminosarum]TAV42106.1 hypothetical protein ELI31_33085 [Rhizobium leguminosarum]TAV42572.1 hypothetical protein ELI32_34395 [Rhizobium leguminosarum]TAV42858.1 hypothetical protein ELI29_32720 [Rhizobium leguminosarum]